MRDRPPLYHFACHHSYLAIGATGALLPPRWLLRQQGRGVPADVERYRRRTFDLIWATDLPDPDRDALGLTMTETRCDRTTHRYRVTDARMMTPWAVMSGIPARMRRELDEAPGARPDHWWVATMPVAVVYDPVTVTA